MQIPTSELLQEFKLTQEPSQDLCQIPAQPIATTFEGAVARAIANSYFCAPHKLTGIRVRNPCRNHRKKKYESYIQPVARALAEAVARADVILSIRRRGRHSKISSVTETLAGAIARTIADPVVDPWYHHSHEPWHFSTSVLSQEPS